MDNNTAAPEVTTEQAAAAIDAGATLIDVREPDEFVAGHVPQAKPIPLGQLMERHSEITRDEKVYVICAAGGRSMTAATALRELGVEAVSIAGGTNTWRQEGRPIATGV